LFLAAQSGILEASAERLLDYGLLGILALGVLLAGWRLWPRLERLIDGYIENAAKRAEARIAREEEEELSEAATTKALRMALPAITGQMERIASTINNMDKRLERLEKARAPLCDPSTCKFAQAALDVQRASAAGRPLERRTDPTLQEET
jgi:hypothetical protein